MADGTAPDPVVALILAARTNFAAFVSLTHRPRFIHSNFSLEVCKAVDEFVEDVIAGKRPVLDMTAPPQHGKSSLISRCLPGYLIGRLGPVLGQCRIALSSYALARAKANLRDAKQVMSEAGFREVFPHASMIGFRSGQNTSDYFDHPFGFIKAQGAGGGLTGFSIDVALNDDLTKDALEALSQTVQDGLESWHSAVLTTRLQQRSGQVNIGTPWSAHDIMARIQRKYEGKPNYKRLRFQALNLETEVGFDPDRPQGALVPELHSEEKLREIKATIADHWWAAMYQSAPMAEMGAIFGKDGIRYYRRSELPHHFVQVIMTLDCAYKDKISSDYTAAGVWGKTQDGRVWLIEMRRQKLAFTATVGAVADLKRAYPRITKIYVEEAANGHAVVDVLKSKIPGVIGVPPTGSKESRAHSVSWAWSNGNVMMPSPEDVPGIAPIVNEIVSFPDSGRNDDAVDCMVMALQQLCLRDPISSMITNDVLRLATGGVPARG